MHSHPMTPRLGTLKIITNSPPKAIGCRSSMVTASPMLKSCSFNAWFVVDIERAVWVGVVVFGGLIIFTSQFKYNITSMPHYPSEIEYSDKYADESYEYRHVVLPREVFKKMQAKGKLLTES